MLGKVMTLVMLCLVTGAVSVSMKKIMGGTSRREESQWMTPRYVDKVVTGEMSSEHMAKQLPEGSFIEKSGSSVHEPIRASKTVQVPHETALPPSLLEVSMHSKGSDLPSNAADGFSPNSYNLMMDLHGSVASDFEPTE